VAVLAAGFVFGCKQMEEQRGEKRIEREIADLQEARGRSGEEAKRIEGELASAKQRVSELEKKLTLARQGITDEVIKERNELSEALQREGKEVRGEVSEAKKSAQEHNVATDKAAEVLRETTPPKDVAAEVETRTEVTPSSPQPVEETRKKESIEIEQVRGVEREQKHEQGDGGAGGPAKSEPQSAPTDSPEQP
jgi:hypothetical protein